MLQVRTPGPCSRGGSSWVIRVTWPVYCRWVSKVWLLEDSFVGSELHPLTRRPPCCGRQRPELGWRLQGRSCLASELGVLHGNVAPTLCAEEPGSNILQGRGQPGLLTTWSVGSACVDLLPNCQRVTEKTSFTKKALTPSLLNHALPHKLWGDVSLWVGPDVSRIAEACICCLWGRRLLPQPTAAAEGDPQPPGNCSLPGPEPFPKIGAGGGSWSGQLPGSGEDSGDQRLTTEGRGAAKGKVVRGVVLRRSWNEQVQPCWLSGILRFRDPCCRPGAA